MVLSEKPWFVASSADPVLKQGLWVMVKPGACVFDPAGAVAGWPDCASPVVMRGRQMIAPPQTQREGDGATARSDFSRWQAITPVIAPGDPTIWQLHPEATGTPGAGDAAAAMLGMKALPYFYLAARVTQREADGTVSAVQLWPVFCGPPPPPSTASDHKLEDLPGSTTSTRPFPGIKPSPMGCSARDADALRGAAVLSEAVASANGAPPATAKWVRAGFAP